ncbi:MAG: TetR family transcriptional regulator [Verrucomicrobiota bacterium]
MKPRSPKDRKTAGRNPQQSQQRILDAALAEFAAKGFAGARVDAIARAARINKRMLYHYFGDKEGLFREVLRRKIAERSASLASAPEDVRELLPHWFQLACRDRDWIRLLEWEALQWGDRKVIDEDRRRESIGRAVERTRRQQSQGMFPAEFDSGQLLLAIMSLTAYPVAFPQLARLVTGFAVSDPEFQRRRETFLAQFASLFSRQQFK